MVVMVGDRTGGLGGLGSIGGLLVVLMTAAAVWKTLGPAVSLRRHSLFLAVKYVTSSGMVLLVATWTHHKSQASGKTPVDSSSRMVRSTRATSAMGSLPMVAMHHSLQSCSHRDLMGSLGVHSVAMLARLLSKSNRVMRP